MNNYEDIINNEFSKKDKRALAKEGVRLAREWMEKNKGSNDKDACAEYIRCNLQNCKGIISGIILSIVVNLIVRFIIDKLFTSIRDEYIGIEDLDIEEDDIIWETEGGIPRFE
jgi:hypothetical protein